MDKQKHKLYMAQILTMVFKDKELCNLVRYELSLEDMQFSCCDQLRG